LQQRVEHGKQIEGRAADHLEHLGSRGLLLQRFAQFTKQSRVFDSDPSLVREGGGEFNLLFSERLHFVASKRKDTDSCPFAQERHTKVGSVPEHLLVARRAVFRIG
jgi:hypothetical protein